MQNSPATARAGRPVAALLALTLAACMVGSAVPAYAESPVSQRPATARPALGADAASVAFQQRLDSSLQRMLDAVLGPGRSAVTTSVELNLDQVVTSSTTHAWDPATGALSERISARSYTAGNGGTRYESSTESRVTALDELRETRRQAPGDVVRLSVAVLVDDTAAAKVDLAQVRELVSVAAGADAGRGDRVTVTAMPMHTEAAAVAQPETESHAALLIAGALLLLAGVMLLAALRWRRRRSRAVPVQADWREPLRVESQLQPSPVAATAVAPISAAPHRDDRERQRAIQAMDPAQAAQQLRGWIGPG
ncbi:hypothetical protein AMIS_28810 [Actinoplanes missouriensis 431]|uniref:Flagellar M-ring C-terminal domain-containing protein n=1 Tax=Actinoplanes missouriensis (strain ATCC 14538 / DSM 43046 / CBS 188.64 / JCM 3121 / NBRC 102363 / NCIMB 12654 / NRRL B-3342 / UNCC 431) TaxID=512565 RepID=I0H514_ACTM4|nr:flagellar M-ring protein FliF C-terminal domain-containing protein [Actinoplanes missouriensis]BAL88101.1 hypothetical protein AMIS_28810 [Actinoplanes missouriensis 431]